MNRGFAKIFRCIEDNVLWRTNEPYCRRAAWIDLILLANHEDKDFILGNQKMIVRKGQRWTSIQKLKERWKWSERKVKAFLKLLESEGMIYLETTNRGSMITLVNYGKFQDFGIKVKEPMHGQKAGQKHEQKAEQKQNDRRTDAVSSDIADAVQTSTTKHDIKHDIKHEISTKRKPSGHSDFFVEE
jgi:DNA replication protein DnaD